jgi:hypothetical protein
VARSQAGLTPSIIIQMAASVTPRRHDAGPTVLDERREANTHGSAASLGGDVLGAHKISVPLERAMRAAEPAALEFGNPLPAGPADGGSTALVDQPHYDPSLLGLVAQRLQQMGAAPLPKAEVVDPARILVRDPGGISDE